MNLFFKQMLQVINSLFDGTAQKNQMWLTYGTFIFGFIISFLTGSISAIFLMFIFSMIGELIYCFVPMKTLDFYNHLIDIPDFKEFKNNFEEYLQEPKHPFNLQDFGYVFVGVVLFVVFKVLFMFF